MDTLVTLIAVLARKCLLYHRHLLEMQSIHRCFHFFLLSDSYTVERISI